MSIWFWLFLGVPAALQFAVPPSAPIGWRRVRTLAALALATLFASLGFQDVFSDVAGRDGISPDHRQAINEVGQPSGINLAYAAFLSAVLLGVLEGAYRLSYRRLLGSRSSLDGKDWVGNTLLVCASTLVAALTAWLFWSQTVPTFWFWFDDPHYRISNAWTWAFLIVVPLLQCIARPGWSAVDRGRRTVRSLVVGLLLLDLGLIAYLDGGLLDYFVIDEHAPFISFIELFGGIAVMAVPSLFFTVIYVGIWEMLWRQHHVRWTRAITFDYRYDSASNLAVLSSKILIVVLYIFWGVISVTQFVEQVNHDLKFGLFGK